MPRRLKSFVNHGETVLTTRCYPDPASRGVPPERRHGFSPEHEQNGVFGWHFPHNPYKILALDLDGTLLNERSRIFAPATRRRSAAHRKAACRSCFLHRAERPRGTRAFSEQLAPPTGLVTSSGAAVQRPDDSANRSSSAASATPCARIFSRSARTLDTDPCFYTTQSLITAARSARCCAGWSRTVRSSWTKRRTAISTSTVGKNGKSARNRAVSVREGHSLSLARHFRPARFPTHRNGAFRACALGDVRRRAAQHRNQPPRRQQGTEPALAREKPSV